MELFIKNLQEIGVLEYSHLPGKLIYLYYIDWSNNNNINNNDLMTSREFKQCFSKKIIDYGYMVKNIKRLKALNTSQFDASLLYNRLKDQHIKNSFNEIIDLNLTSTIYINEKLLNK